jgi:hypothetical protein
MTDVREIIIYISNISNNVLRDLTLTKILFSHFVGIMGFLIRYSMGNAKQKHGQLKNITIILNRTSEI